MSTNYSKHFPSRKESKKATPQSQPIPGAEQVKNNAGGFVYELDKWALLDRFLILGSEGGTYYVGEKTLTRDNAKNVLDLIAEDGVRVVERIVEISDAGRAPKNDPALLALALAASASLTTEEQKRIRQLEKGKEGGTLIEKGEEELSQLRLRDLYYQEVRQAALAALPRVARIGTHLFHFAEYVQSFRGWGRALRKAIANWYNAKEVEQVIHQVTKYKARDGWSHRDLLRLSHPKTEDKTRNTVYQWITNPKETKLGRSAALAPLRAAVQLSTETNVKEAIKLIKEYGFPREVLATELLKSKEVWATLLTDMPPTALIRNLGKLTSLGLLAPLTAETKLAVAKLTDKEALRKGRVHPFQLLLALEQYRKGHGDKGSLTWAPNQQICDALDEAFYLAFEAVVPTGKNILLALDLSGSMGWTNMFGSNINARTASAAMALITMATEKNYHIMGFTKGAYPSMHSGYPSGLSPLKISARMRLDTVVKNISDLEFGGTNCAVPMLYAAENKLDVDAFVIYTDNETWFGDVHPSQALKNYRQKFGKPSKLIVVGMAGNEFTIADPKDRGMLDVVGFDSAAPAIMSDFIRE